MGERDSLRDSPFDSPRDSIEAGYEVADASPRGIFWTGVFALTVGITLCLVLRALFLHYKRELPRQEPPRTGITRTVEIPPEPRLQLNPRIDLIELHRRNLERLTTSGWVDRQSGTVHIPIEDAMNLLVSEEQRRTRKP